jgi:sec-independent protein translocase protein TatB
VLDNLGGLEIVGLILVALFIIGPERLPKVLSDAMRAIRKLREMARNATSDLSRELGTNIELEDLHPKTFLRKHLLSEAEEDAIRRPFQDLHKEVRGVADSFDLKKDLSSGSASPEVASPADAPGVAPSPSPDGAAKRRSFDDAT